MTQQETVYDVQYRCANWPADRWQNLGHTTTDRAEAEQLARGSATIEPHFEYRVSPVVPANAPAAWVKRAQAGGAL